MSRIEEIINEIKKLDDGYIIYTNRPLLNAEKAAIKFELAAMAAGKLGLLFFRTEARA